MSIGEKWVCNTGLQPIGPIVPNWAPRWSYLLSATHVHTTTHCMFYREQPWVPYLLRLDLIAYVPLVPQYTSSELSNFSATSWRENKLIFNKMMMRSVLSQTNRLSWIFIVLAHWNNRYVAPLWHIILIPSQRDGSFLFSGGSPLVRGHFTNWVCCQRNMMFCIIILTELNIQFHSALKKL